MHRRTVRRWRYIGWTLQGQTNPPTVGLTTAWHDVPGSTATNQFIMPIDSTDGSVFFRVPAQTPISIQPLDESGAALQLMRSWMTAMPGETVASA